MEENTKRVSFNDFNEPIRKVSEIIISYLKKNKQEEELFGYVLAVLCESSFHTYKAICHLLSKDNKFKYVAQAWALVRSIIDIYFSVVYLIDNPKENTKKFNLVTFRIMHDDYKKIVKQFQTDPIISGNPNEFKEMLLSNGKYFGLSDYEMNNIDNLNKNQRLWPIPSLIIKRVSSSETQSFLKRIYDNQYSKCSDIAHYTGLGIGMSVYAQSPDSMKTQPGRFESDAVVMAIEFLTMIYSEIQIVINCGIEQDLKNIWGLLIKHNMENADSLHKKYSNFLK